MERKVQFVFDERSEATREDMIRRGFQEVTIGNLHWWIPNYAKVCNCLQNKGAFGSGHWESCPSYVSQAIEARREEVRG